MAKATSRAAAPLQSHLETDELLEEYRQHYRVGSETDLQLRLTRGCTLVARRWRKYLDERLRRIGQSQALWEALLAVAMSREGSALGAIAKRVGVEGPTFVRMIAHGRAFNCDQARELLAAFDSDPNREHAAITIFQRLTDPQNFYRVLEVFQSDPFRQSVRRRLKLEQRNDRRRDKRRRRRDNERRRHDSRWGVSRARHRQHNHGD